MTVEGSDRSPARRPRVVARRVVVLTAGVLLVVLVAVALPRNWWVLAFVVVATVVAVVPQQSISPTGIIAQVALGTASISMGIGIGIRVARGSGLSIPALLGWMALVGGIAVLGRLAREVLRSVAGWWRLSLLPVAIVTLLMIYAAFPAVMAAAPGPTPLGPASPADRGVTGESVSLATDDGVRLAAWYRRSENGAAVIVLHGSGSNRAAVMPQAAVLARNGFGVLMLDARGHGASGGQGMDFGWYGDRDTAAGVDWLLRQADVRPDRIAVLGLSMGGEEAIGAIGADQRIRAAVAEGATARTAADKAAWLPGGPLGALQRGLDRVTFGLAALLSGAAEPASLRAAASRASPRPILLIAAGTVPDEARAAAAVKAASPSTVQVWVVPDAGHTGGLAAHPVEWEAATITFLRSSLGLA